MSDVVISVENLSKSYLIGHDGPQERYHSLRDALVRHGKNYVRKAVDMARGRQIIQGDSVEEFWALKDVSFEVKRGEVLGIIGRNGAGKSTLLKILSRITEPTSGRVVLDGRVASLLEVGTGFHPELTGRENIFLNGAILGMTKVEIRKKFDEIVEFSEVENFLDTPVKRYSSGMYVRLAFAVAAHLEPEILIVDEVLAVGDGQFQKKCLGKMQDVAGQGRTVLFVSHNMAAVTSLCDIAILLESGRIKCNGPTSIALQSYLSSEGTDSGEYVSPKINTPTPYLKNMRILQNGRQSSNLVSGQEAIFEFEINHDGPIRGACFSLQIINQFLHPVLHCWIYDQDFPFCRSSGPTRLVCRIPNLRLNVGRYTVNTFLSEPPGGTFFDICEGVCPFVVEMHEEQTLFGWRDNACAYHVDFDWS